MPIFLSPDRTQYPPLPDTQICNELEALTGSDLCLTRFPLPVSESTLQSHISAKALFVQIKIGYDILSFDALRNFCARVQKCQIPKTQAILLRVGEYWEDENNLLRIKSSRPFGNTAWNDYQRLLMACDVRGVNVVPEIRDINELGKWLDNRVAIFEKTENEGKREIYPPRVEPRFEIDDIWQLIEEVPDDTIEYLLCAGMKGLGQSTITAVRQYFQDELPHLPPAGHYFLSVLTDMENGKLKHNIKGWGVKRAQKLRYILMLPDNINLSLNGSITENDYLAGWNFALETFKNLIDEGHSVKDSFNACVKMAKDLIPF